MGILWESLPEDAISRNKSQQAATSRNKPQGDERASSRRRVSSSRLRKPFSSGPAENGFQSPSHPDQLRTDSRALLIRASREWIPDSRPEQALARRRPCRPTRLRRRRPNLGRLFFKKSVSKTPNIYLFTLFQKSAASFQLLLVSVSFHGPAPAESRPPPGVSAGQSGALRGAKDSEERGGSSQRRLPRGREGRVARFPRR